MDGLVAYPTRPPAVVPDASPAQVKAAPAGVPRAAGSGPLLRLRLEGRTALFVAATGEEVLARAHKARAVFAVLALATGQSMARPRLAGLLWSRSHPTERLARLRNTLHEVREAVGRVAYEDTISVERGWMTVRAGALCTDVLRGWTPTAEAGPAGRAWGATDHEFGSDLDRLDPELAEWLAQRRHDLRRLQADGGGADRGKARAQPAPGQNPSAPQGGREPGGLAEGQASFLPEVASADATTTRATPGPARAVLAVSTFAAAGDPTAGRNDHQIARALSRAAAEALSRLTWLVVTLDGGAPLGRARDAADDAEAGGGVGPDLVLEGEVRSADDGRTRVSLRLTHAADGALAWSDRFEAPSASRAASFEFEDEVAASVAAQVDLEMLPVETARVRRLRAAASRARAGSPGAGDGLAAYEHVLRALPALHRMDKASFVEAGRELGLAAALAPGLAAAHAWRAYHCVLLVGQGWAVRPHQVLALAGASAERAVDLDPLDARALAIAGHVRAFLHGRVREALDLHARALLANPNLPLALLLAGVARCYAGDLDEARGHLLRHRALAPRDPGAFMADNALAMVELLARRHEDAAALGRRVTEVRPGFTTAYKTYLSALGHLGRRADAHPDAGAAYKRLLDLEPDFSVAKFLGTSRYSGPGHSAHYAAGLALAGVAAKAD